MRYLEFGLQKTKVSEVILGTMRIWEKTPEEVATLIESALDAGINAVDTAPIYGPSEGKSREEWYEVYLSAGNRLP